ncbi:MAG TPA: AI-2E family transporter, partial [Lacipirellulaceae bacterium]|nr:AI-2E family transporter [Lacipirellulaceae bacterium]
MNNAQVRNEQVWLVVGSLMVLATVALATALVYTRDVMIPFVLSIFVTAAVSPMVDYQVRRWRVPTLLAVLTTLLLVFAMMTLLGMILVVAVQTMVHAATEYGAQVNSLITGMFIELNAYLANSKLVHLQVDEQRVSAELQSYLPDVITQTAGTVTTLASHGLLILFFVVFLLLGRNPHQRRKDIYAEI